MTYVSFHPNSQLMTYSVGAMVGILDETGKIVRTYYGSNPIFSRSGKYLAYGTPSIYPNIVAQVKMIDFDTDTVKDTFNFAPEPTDLDNATSWVFSPDERYLAVGGFHHIDIWDLETKQLIKKKIVGWENEDGTGSDVVSMSYYPDGNKIIFSAYGPAWPLSGKPPYITRRYVWDLVTDSVSNFPYGWGKIKMSNDGTKLVILNWRPSDSVPIAYIVDLLTQEIVGTIPYDGGGPMDDGDVAFSPDGKYVAYVRPNVVGRKNYVNIWSIEKNELVYVGNYYGGYACDFSPDGKYLAIGWSVYVLDFERILERWFAMSVGTVLPATVVFPNPTHDVVQIQFTLQESAQTTITIADALGNTVKIVEDKFLPATDYTYTIELEDIASGMYFLRIQSGNRMFNQKIVVTH